MYHVVRREQLSSAMLRRRPAQATVTGAVDFLRLLLALQYKARPTDGEMLAKIIVPPSHDTLTSIQKRPSLNFLSPLQISKRGRSRSTVS